MVNANLKPLVIYHDPCLDGIASAWVLHTHFKGEVLLHPAAYGDDLPDPAKILDRDVYIVDFSYPTAELNTLAIYAANVIVIDHHESAIRKIDTKKLAPGVVCKLDTSMAGCELVWDHFHPHDSVPYLLACIADRDIRKNKIADAKAICTALYARELTVRSISRTMILPDTEAELLKQGELLIAQQDKQIAWHIKHAMSEILLKPCCYFPAIHAPYTITSDMAETFLADHPHEPLLAVYESAGDKGWKISLRCRKGEDEVNVARIAETFGGGGHQAAAGFYVDSIEEMLR